ncbi:hypothetical protein [Nevskia soli]|uniref:hypothetical protein n=1 Tax=Nevskia soli TaxID=418856 RepID=UPI0012F95328|nr:hypothetical protein [Nevskia soli]
MSNKIESPEAVQARRDAQRLRKSLGIPQHEALEQVAKRRGFSSWHALIHAGALPLQQKYEIPIGDQWDIAIVLYDSKALIREVHATGLPGLLIGEEIFRRVNVLMKGGVFSVRTSRLCEKFERVLKGILGGRDIDQLGIDDWKLVAAQYGEWIEDPSAWVIAAYECRHAEYLRGAGLRPRSYGNESTP